MYIHSKLPHSIVMHPFLSILFDYYFGNYCTHSHHYCNRHLCKNFQTSKKIQRNKRWNKETRSTTIWRFNLFRYLRSLFQPCFFFVFYLKIYIIWKIFCYFTSLIWFLRAYIVINITWNSKSFESQDHDSNNIKKFGIGEGLFQIINH